MRKFCCLLFFSLFLLPGATAQEAEMALTQQDLAVIDAIKAKNRSDEKTTPAAETSPTSTAATAQPPMQAPAHTVAADAADNDIQLSEYAKQEAWQDQKETQQRQEQPSLPAQQDSEEPAETSDSKDASSAKCLTVAFIDIDVAFNEHPRTQSVKKQIDLKIKSKQREVENAKDIITALEAENILLARQMAELKPFYERIVTDQFLLPKVSESADTLVLGNTLNRLLFSGCEILSTSPLNSPARLDDVTERIGANKKIIAERMFFIDNYKYQTREEILNLEQQEVKAILQDIYAEIKSFAQKRNIGAIVRKDEILYGQKPVNVTKDFVSRLKKSKKYRKK